MSLSGCIENIPIANPLSGVQRQRITIPTLNLRCSAMRRRRTRSGINIDNHLLLIESVAKGVILSFDSFHWIEARMSINPDPQTNFQLWQAVITSQSSKVGKGLGM